MRIGIIVECGPQGAERAICEPLARHVEDVQVSCATLDNKRQLIADCGDAASVLLAQGCDGIIILWDLYPDWRLGGERPCRHDDREDIFASLRAANVPLHRVRLVCIREELEAWLLCDGRALSAVLSTAAHPVHIRDQRRPDRVRNPKAALNRLFVQNRRMRYVDRYHAIEIIRALTDLTRLRRSESFLRFEAYIREVAN